MRWKNTKIHRIVCWFVLLFSFFFLFFPQIIFTMTIAMLISSQWQLVTSYSPICDVLCSVGCSACKNVLFQGHCKILQIETFPSFCIANIKTCQLCQEEKIRKDCILCCTYLYMHSYKKFKFCFLEAEYSRTISHRIGDSKKLACVRLFKCSLSDSSPVRAGSSSFSICLSVRSLLFAVSLYTTVQTC